jgi:dTDP-glucose pyrophosphorylase
MIDESMDKAQMDMPAEPWEFRSKPSWQRLIIMVGGVLFNLILAIVIYSSVLFVWGDQYLPTQNATYGITVSETGKELGLQNGDKIISIDGIEIEDNVWQVKDMVEKPSRELAPSNMAVLGRYIITPEIFEILEDTKPGAGNEIQLTDALKTLLSKRDVYAYNFEGIRYDVGDKLGYLQASVEYAIRRNELSEPFKEYLVNLTQSDLFLKGTDTFKRNKASKKDEEK